MYFSIPLHGCVPGGKEKATVAPVAILGALQRSQFNLDTSTKVLFVQGQIIENHHNTMRLIASLGTTGVTNTKGGKRH